MPSFADLHAPRWRRALARGGVGFLVAAALGAGACGTDSSVPSPSQTSPAPLASAEPAPIVAAGSTSGSAASSGPGSDDGELVLEPDTTTGEPAPDPLAGEVGPGDSLSKILNRAGLGGPEIQRVAAALQPVMDPAAIRVGQRFSIELDEGGELLSFAFHRSVTEVARVRREDDGTLKAQLEELETERHEEEIGGTVHSSLWAALTERGHSPALIDVLVDTFAYDIDLFTATREGDRFRMVVERHELDGKLVRYGRVLAAQYEGKAAGEVTVLWWEPPGGGPGRYVDAEGRGVARTMLKSPLKYARISSGFDPKRMHPVLHRVKSHQGVDYAAPEGTPVWAAADGKIVWRAEKGGSGNLVVLTHAGGLKTLYMHLSRFASGQAVGDTVKAKTVIGYVGQTGLATGPHLHFGMQKNGRYVDPTSIESVRANGVASGDRARFAKALTRWKARLADVPVAGDTATPPDAGAQDAGAQDAGEEDAGEEDAGEEDAIARDDGDQGAGD